jgi:ubiquinone/menaquinone biosynthesis C-methylase UbiE
MAEHENVYHDETERYHALVSFEDYSNHLQASIQSIIPAGSSILETGAGTGRVTALLTPLAGKLVSLDLSVPMLIKALASTPPNASTFSGYATADHRFLPVSDHQYDWIISGWSVCYLVSWHQGNWKQEVNHALKEFSRILHPDGHVLLIETLGTGETSPNPPDHLKAYLDYLDSLGFQRRWIRTDYRFPDDAAARDLTGFFFGDGMVKNITFHPVPVLPECTGLWTISQTDLLKNLPG